MTLIHFSLTSSIKGETYASSPQSKITLVENDCVSAKHLKMMEKDGIAACSNTSIILYSQDKFLGMSESKFVEEVSELKCGQSNKQTPHHHHYHLQPRILIFLLNIHSSNWLTIRPPPPWQAFTEYKYMALWKAIWRMLNPSLLCGALIVLRQSGLLCILFLIFFYECKLHRACRNWPV